VATVTKAILVPFLKVACVPVAKAASSSIKESLRDALRMPPLAQPWRIHETQWPHLAAPGEVPAHFMTFSCVRHPCARVWSAWASKNRADKFQDLTPHQDVLWEGMTFEQFADALNLINLRTANEHLALQSELLRPWRKHLHWTFRMETLARNWWMTGLGPLPKVNQAGGKPRMTQRSRQIIASLYRQDFEEFGYSS
jgi:hypothetical protein